MDVTFVIPKVYIDSVYKLKKAKKVHICVI